MKRINKIYLSAALLLGGIGFGAIADNVLVYKDGAIVFQGPSALVDKVRMENDNQNIGVYAADGSQLYSVAVSDIDSVKFVSDAPVADMLDVVFNADGTATDVSPMHNDIESVTSDNSYTAYYSDTYQRYVASFNNTWGGKTSSYFKIDYSENQEFKDKLADGHTLEAVVMANYEPPIKDGEAKFFASHEAGGTGLMVCKAAKGLSGESELDFLPHVGGSWQHAATGIVPVPQQYYHIVGVWNKEEGKAYVYVDGKLMNTVDAAGDFKFPNANSNWFAIGCDAGPSAQLGWNGDVVIARIYDKPLTQGEVKALWNDVDRMQSKPKADILDVRFNADGTAEDVSPMKNNVETFAGNTLETYYSNTYNRYVARFSNTWGNETSSGYYKIDYSENQAFKDALANGHTLEAVFTADYPDPITNKEVKVFTSQEAGGTGIMICKTGNGKNGLNELTFLPNASPDGKSKWIWATSGIMPERETFYHVVGVWNQEEGKAYIYVNGQLENTVDAEGTFKFPSAAANWFGIGADAGTKGVGQAGWSGDVAIARIYDKPLSAAEVEMLWEDVVYMQENAQQNLVNNVKFFNGAAVKKGGSFTISGEGFQDGDKLKVTSVDDETMTLTLDGTVEANGALKVTIPAELPTGSYKMRLTLLRGEQSQDLGTNTFVIVDVFPQPAKIIAHRGYWDIAGSAQNSLAAIKEAQKIGMYGAEIDVWLTTDGHIMLCHDAALNGVTIQTSTYDQVKDLTLSNGEKIPELKDCLALLKDADTKLIIEIKTHDSAEKNEAVSKATVAAVKEAGMEDKVEYIAFDLANCRTIVAEDPEAIVSYLSGGMSPTGVNGLGIKGIDYSMAEFRDHPEWITQAKELGMYVNAWTVNTIADMTEMVNLGVEYITTDKPLDAIDVMNYYSENQ